MARRRKPAQDGTLFLGDQTGDSEPSASLQWLSWAKILNVPGLKYTVGNGKGVDKDTLADVGGQYLVFHNRVDVACFHFEIVVDANSRFWIHALSKNVWVNGVRLSAVEDKARRLKFGDVLFVTEALQEDWNPRWTPRDSCCGERNPLLNIKTDTYKANMVLRFLKLTSSKTSPLHPLARDRNVPLQRSNFLKDATSTSGPTWHTDVVLRRIFESTSDQSDLFKARLVCRSWERAASQVLGQHHQVSFSMEADDPSNHTSLRLLEFRERMDPRRLNFERWKVVVCPTDGYVLSHERDTPKRRAVMERLQFDYLSLLSHTCHVVRHLHLNCDYLPFLNATLATFRTSLESLRFQANPLWMTDARALEFPFLSFPALKTLQLDFILFESQDLEVLKDLKWLTGFLKACSRVEALVLNGFADVIASLGQFSKLRRLKLLGCNGTCFYRLHLLPALQSLATLPLDCLTSFQMNLDGCHGTDGSVGSSEATSRNLHLFLKHQTNLERLELVFPANQHFLLPRGLVNLRKLWVSKSASCKWGTMLASQVHQGGTVLRALPSGLCLKWLPLVTWDGVSQISLVFGKWDLESGTFAVCIPNVDRIWAWTQ